MPSWRACREISSFSRPRPCRSSDSASWSLRGASPGEVDSKRRSPTTVIPITDSLITQVAALRHACRRDGHPLANSAHANDLWIAASTIHVRAKLVTADGLFTDVPDSTCSHRCSRLMVGTTADPAFWGRGCGGLDHFDGDIVGMSGEGLEVGSIAGQHGPARLGDRHDESVDSGARSSPAPEFGGSPGDDRADLSFDDAGLQEAVGIGIAPAITSQRLDEDHRRDDSWPQPGSAQRSEQRERGLRPR